MGVKAENIGGHLAKEMVRKSIEDKFLGSILTVLLRGLALFCAEPLTF